MHRSFEQVIRSNINNSKSKQAHAFPHEPRFHVGRTTSPQVFYDLTAQMMSSQIKKKQRSISQSARDIRASTPSPGPLAYRLKSFLDQNTNKKIGPTFNQQKRLTFQQKQKKPGPGAYSPKILNDKQLAFTMRPRLQHPLSKSLVGPGQYQIQKYNTITEANNYYSKYAKPQTFKIGTEQRFHSPNFSSPAPNQYANKHQTLRQTFSFGRQKRHSIIQGSAKTPGPGDYFEFSEFAGRRRNLQNNLRKMQKIVKEK